MENDLIPPGDRVLPSLPTQRATRLQGDGAGVVEGGEEFTLTNCRALYLQIAVALLRNHIDELPRLHSHVHR
jgi:hypothetical protein